MKTILQYCGLAALLAGAAFCLPTCGDNGTGPAQYDGPWKIVRCPNGPTTLKAVFFLKRDLGYAVGNRHIIKYDGASWNLDYVYKEGNERYSVALEDVWFNAPDDGWVSGHEYDLETKTSDALLLNYDGKEWKRFDHNTAATGFYALYFLNANEGWAAGFGICRWDGSKWEYVSDLTRIVDIYFNSSSDGWAVGYYDEKIYHYDGSTWTRVHEDPWGIKLYSVFFTSPDRGWAAGWYCISGTQSNILGYKKGRWDYYREAPWTEGIRRDIYGLHFSDPGNGWGVGQRTFRWDGERWWFGDDPPLDKRGMLYDVFTLNENEAWAVGGARTILHYEP